MATTQADRILRIDTPLGEDFLLLDTMTAYEGISRLFSIKVSLLHEEDLADYTPTFVDVNRILGKGVTIKVKQSDGTSRVFNGMVARFSQGTRHTRFSFYEAEIVPHVWLLTHKRQSRIFQNKSVEDIISEVLRGFEFSIQLDTPRNKRNYCVQYQETDWDFVSRLMEEEGIFYFFEHSENVHKLIISDTSKSHQPCPVKSEIEYFHKVDETDKVATIQSWSFVNRILTGKVTLWDHHFQQPANKNQAELSTRFQLGGNQQLEIYEYPGGYARKYDGISASGGEQTGELSHISTDKEKTVKNYMEIFEARHETANGSGDCPSITSGFRFSMKSHPNATLNADYVVTEVTHQARQSPSYVSDEAVGDPYLNRFTAIGYGAGKPTFRPEFTTSKPIIHGSQTAIVVGPAGEDIFVDKYGRVKVQFHWDRQGHYNESSSCWVRVAQGWAGKKWGMIFTPRIGMEVIVHFLDGDPDRPIITGCVYNAEAMPPYALPDEKTKSTIKSDSSKGGGGFNEIRIEDKKGSEQLFIHAQKDQDIRVNNDCKEIVIHDRHLIVDNDQFEKVKKDKHLKVGGDQNEEIGGTFSKKVGAEIHEKAGSNVAVEAGMGVHIKAGTSAVIEAGASLTLKVGGNFININPSGVAISGTIVLINSGGAAGTGAGCQPDPPIEPKEADRADAGQRAALPPAGPPAPVTNFSPLALSFASAARSGCPFVDT
ncbi:MAG: type VI secretion system tip protein TssI/VgrG [Pyrinomonadaceae bacterium]|nr:type VI secretion system tip protein TssI/VgrG [Pyrinomonadaceae bacterium]